MIEILSNWDKKLFLYLNGFHSSLMDYVMTLFTLTPIWALFYLVILWIIIRKYGKKSILIIVSLFLIILLADQISGVFKNSVQRLRPSNDPEISLLAHVFFTKGGQFGFVSAHAANAFSFAVFSLLLFQQKIYSIFILSWATLIAYTRIYLGLHYPGDILGGALLGSFIGWGIFRLLILVEYKYFPIHPFKQNRIDFGDVELILCVAGSIILITFSSIWFLLKNGLIQTV